MGSRNEEITRKFNAAIKDIHENKNVEMNYSNIIAMALDNPKIIKRGIEKIVSNNIEAVQRNILISENKSNLIYEIMKFYKTDEEMAAIKAKTPDTFEDLKFITDKDIPLDVSEEEIKNALDNKNEIYNLIVKGRLKLIPSSVVISKLKELCGPNNILSNMIMMNIDITNQFIKIGSKKLRTRGRTLSTDDLSYYDKTLINLNCLISADTDDPLKSKARERAIDRIITKMIENPCKLLKTFKTICDSSSLLSMHFNWLKDHYTVPKDNEADVTIFKENSYINTLSAFLQMIFAVTLEENYTIRYGLLDQITSRNAISSYLNLKGDNDLINEYNYILEGYDNIIKEEKYDYQPLLFAIRGSKLYDVLLSVKSQDAYLGNGLKENGILAVYPKESVFELFQMM